MRRLIFALTLTAATASTSLLAQSASSRTPTPPPSVEAPRAESARGQTPTPPAAAPAAPSRPPQLSGPAVSGNIRLQITITDTYGGTPQKKTVAIVLMSGHSGMIRTQNQLFVQGAGAPGVRLNVDAMATAYASGQVSTRLTVSYVPVAVARENGRDSPTTPLHQQNPGVLEESIVVILTDGKPMVLSESADPATDRKVTLEATATILK